jgi:uncharacterized protein YycO
MHHGIMRFIPIFVLLITTGCHSFMVERPQNRSVDEAYTRAWTEQIRREAKTGDVLLSRGYALISDTVDVFTAGEPVSHSVIYDAERGTVIEAVSVGVREIPLEQYVKNVHRVILVRPSGLTAKERRDVVARARAMKGHAYDYSGLFGIDDPDRFYCSELVAWALRVRERGLPVSAVVSPAELVKYGTVLFDSGPRDEVVVAAR